MYNDDNNDDNSSGNDSIVDGREMCMLRLLVMLASNASNTKWRYLVFANLLILIKNRDMIYT